MEKLKKFLSLAGCAFFPLDEKSVYLLRRLRTLANLKEIKVGDIPCLYLLDYGHPLVRKAIFKFKYKLIKEFAELFAELVADALIEELSWRGAWTKKNVILVPVPAHKSRLRKFGKDHMKILGELLFEKLAKANPNLKYAPSALVRVKKTEPQYKLNRKERKENLKNAFSLNLRASDSLFVLLDDIISTGSTLKEAQRTLKRAGTNNDFLFVTVSAQKLINRQAL